MINSNTVFASNFYIRGDIGLGSLATEKQSNITRGTDGSKVKLKGKNFNSIDIGVGYYVLNNLKA